MECLLFAWGDLLKLSEIAQVLEVSKPLCKELLLEYEEKLKQEERGLRLVQVEDSYQLSTKPELFAKVQEYAKGKQKKSLSNAAMETLSIVAYQQPILKTDIEEIRGVRCDQVLKNLMDAELVEVVDRLEVPGRPNVYGTTEFFLKKFGLKSIEDLPSQEIANEPLNFLEE